MFEQLLKQALRQHTLLLVYYYIYINMSLILFLLRKTEGCAVYFSFTFSVSSFS